jgi:hypothetical protein
MLKVPRHESVGGVQVTLYAFLTSVLGRREWSASRSRTFISGESVPHYPLVRRLGGPRGRSGRDGEEKNPCS